MLTGPMDRDFGALRELLGALLASSFVHVVFDVVFFSSSKLLGMMFSSARTKSTQPNPRRGWTVLLLEALKC